MKNLKPLIKWTGGKSSEIKQISSLIPEYEKYIEPFFGGGALFFDLQPTEAFINDLMPDLMQFYRFIKTNNQKFHNEIKDLTNFWYRIPIYKEVFDFKLIDVYFELRDEFLAENEFIKIIDYEFENSSKEFNRIFNNSFQYDHFELKEKIRESVKNRLLRLVNRIDNKKRFDCTDVNSHIETAFRNGFYMLFRDIYNSFNIKGKMKLESKIAIFYFIREFCFGGMFRESQSGGFNIPYGGQNYNKKDFNRKVFYMLSSEVKDLFKNTQIETLDFELAIKKAKPSKNDFIFLDPPYDTNFSKYGDNSFSKDDHRRLSHVLHNLNSKFILIIKETSFIRSLYDKSNKFQIEEFNKKYASNIKSRYDRDVKHLIIHNV